MSKYKDYKNPKEKENKFKKIKTRIKNQNTHMIC